LGRLLQNPSGALVGEESAFAGKPCPQTL
jgi:hypothetical protein